MGCRCGLGCADWLHWLGQLVDWLAGWLMWVKPTSGPSCSTASACFCCRLHLCAAGRLLNGTYGRRVALHESGHFLIAYLLGLLPRGYTLSSLDLFLR